MKSAVPAAQQRIAAAVRATAQMLAQHSLAVADPQMQAALGVQSAGMVEVYLYTNTPLTPTMLETLEQHGVRVLRSAAQWGIVYAAISPGQLESIAVLPFIRWIGSPVYSQRRTGSVTQ
ncbi:MAG: hypothetical protein FJZ47_21780 [Candidatus Tectomicrobia bacterium]|uniref:Uncharacterized protein n=1 Tax=Tectimicrobiota bacterium TaxID=2528274 RepID=A0A937W569_UNCTE|nr:hypothetical protein [Candidatus Tectomicrobia bacterium]